jgi:hypothetical protein
VTSDSNTSSCTVELETGRAFASTVKLKLGWVSARSTSIDVRVDTVVAQNIALLATSVDIHEVTRDANTSIGSGQDGVLFACHTVVNQLAATRGASVVAK